MKNYRGKRPRGMTANQIAAAAITFLLALLALTIMANATMLGVPVRQQVHDIVFTEVG